MFLFRDFLAMLSDLRREAPHVDRWGAALNLPQIFGALFFITTRQAQLILAANIVTLVIASQIHKRRPFSRLAGMCHVIWIPLLPYLVWTLWTAPANTAFWYWLLYVAATMGLCLVLDAREVHRYLTTDDKTYA
jgi:hypothetical protein